MSVCPECATPLEAARSLVAGLIEATLLEPRGSWSCVGCLAVVVANGNAIETRVRGSALSRSIEHLRRAADDGRLVAEAERLGRDPATWFVARVPEVFSLFGWRPGMRARLIDGATLVTPTPRREHIGRASVDIERPPVEYAALFRRFNGFPSWPEEIAPRPGWTSLPSWLHELDPLEVAGAIPPAISLRIPPGRAVGRPSFEEIGVTHILAYADALVPVMP